MYLPFNKKFVELVSHAHFNLFQEISLYFSNTGEYLQDYYGCVRLASLGRPRSAPSTFEQLWRHFRGSSGSAPITLLVEWVTWGRPRAAYRTYPMFVTWECWTDISHIHGGKGIILWTDSQKCLPFRMRTLREMFPGKPKTNCVGAQETTENFLEDIMFVTWTK